MRLLLALLIMFISFKAQSNVLFEGWFEVYIGLKKVGYSVQRYEFENNKFKAVTYLKTNADGSNITESIKAFADGGLKPLSYSYTSKVGKEIKVIDASFSGDKMNLKINDGKKDTKKTVVLKKPGTFLSVFTPYVLLSQKKDENGDGGLQVSKKNIIYTAVAEEDGGVYNGVIKIPSLDKVKGKEAFKVLNKFKDQQFISWITSKGEFLLSRAPDLNLEMRISDSMGDATKDMSVNLADIKLLFGKIPGETIANDEVKDKKLFEKHDTTKTGLPQQPGVMIKGVPTQDEKSGENKK